MGEGYRRFEWDPWWRHRPVLRRRAGGSALALTVAVVHLWFRHRHRELVRIQSAQAELEDGEEDFPMRLGLRY